MNFSQPLDIFEMLHANVRKYSAIRHSSASSIKPWIIFFVYLSEAVAWSLLNIVRYSRVSTCEKKILSDISSGNDSFMFLFHYIL